jgi:hypothetical protein
MKPMRRCFSWGAHAPRVLAMAPPPSRTSREDCFGEAPKPTREARALPRSRQHSRYETVNHRVVLVVLLAAVTALVQETMAKDATPMLAAEADDKAWSFSLYTTTYVVPDFHEYVQPTFTADRGWFHLETRYNYENLETGSIWLGYNFGGGEKVEWEFTPIVGGVFGETNGIGPGYKLSLSYGKLEFSSEGEFVFDLRDDEGSFLYFWSELSFAPVDWFRFGLVGQRTRAYQSDVDIQRGLLVGVTYKEVDFTTYVFNLDHGKPTWVFSVGVTF